LSAAKSGVKLETVSAVAGGVAITARGSGPRIIAIVS
jgi:hypothetical protein